MSEVFERNCIVKCDLFCYFLLALRLSARKSEIKKNSDDVHWNVCAKIKTLYARNNIFLKKNPNYEILIHLNFGSNFVFWRAALGRFFNFSSSANHCGRHFYSVLPPP